MPLDLPPDIEQLAERRAAEGGFRDAADYVGQLIAADAGIAADPALEAALLESLDDECEEWDANAIRAGCRAALANALARS